MAPPVPKVRRFAEVRVVEMELDALAQGGLAAIEVAGDGAE